MEGEGLMKDSKVEVTLDPSADVAYIRLLSRAVVETVELTDSVLLDLDEHRMVVGIEMLSTSAVLPYEELETKYHVPSSASDVVRALIARGSVSGESFGLSAHSENAGALTIDNDGLVGA